MEEQKPMAFRAELQPDRLARQRAVRLQRHGSIMTVHEPVPLETRIEVTPERIEEEVFLDAEPLVDVLFLEEIFIPGAVRGDLDHQSGSLLLFPELVDPAEPLRDPLRDVDIRRDDGTGVSLNVVEEEVTANMDIRLVPIPALQGLDQVGHLLPVELGFRHRLAVLLRVMDLSLGRNRGHSWLP